MKPIKDLDDLLSRPPAEIREYVNAVEAYMRAGEDEVLRNADAYYESLPAEEKLRLDTEGWSITDFQAAVDHRPSPEEGDG